MNCNHTAFHVTNNVARNIDQPSGHLSLSLSFRVRCSECDKEFAIDPSSLEVAEFGLRGHVMLLNDNPDEPVIRAGTVSPADQTLEELLAKVGLADTSLQAFFSPETPEVSP